MTCLMFTAYILLLRRKNPFAETRQWAQQFRYASLGTGCLASILRCASSSTISVPQTSIDALAAAVVILLVLALTMAVVSFERGMLTQARHDARQHFESFRRAKRLVLSLKAQGIEMNELPDRKFLSKVEVHFPPMITQLLKCRVTV